MFRRRRAAEPSAPSPPPPPSGELVALRHRARSAVALIEASSPGSLAAATAARSSADLDDAAERLATGRQRLAVLDPERITAELKDARRRREGATADDERRRLDAVVDAAERRYTAVHRLWDRTEAIEQEAEVVVARLEELAASVVVPGARSDAELERLQLELQALAETYRELDDPA